MNSIYSVGTYHSATGAIESALKYVSHWIARRPATAGRKCIKMRPLSTAATSPVTNHYQSLLRCNKTTARLRVQRSPTSKHPSTCPASDEHALALPTSANLRGASSSADTRAGNPAQISSDSYRSLPAESSLLRSGKFVVHITALFRATIHRSNEPARTA
jgi:hypothetical protein